MSRAAHDAVRGVLDLSDGDAVGGGSARLTQECRQQTVRQALGAAHEAIIASGFAAEDAARSLAAVAMRRGARGATTSTALDWLCLRLDADILPKIFVEDDDAAVVLNKKKVASRTEGKLEVVALTAQVKQQEQQPVIVPQVVEVSKEEEQRLEEQRVRLEAEERKAFALRYAQGLAEAEEDAERKEKNLAVEAAAFEALPVETRRLKLTTDLEAKRERHAELKVLVKAHADALLKKRRNQRKAAAAGGDKWESHDELERLGTEIAKLTKKLSDLPPPTGEPQEAVVEEIPEEELLKELAKEMLPDEEELPATLFAEEPEDPKKKPHPISTEPVVVAVQEAARPTVRAISWSGVTPRQKLEQWCRERGNPAPQYEVASKTEVRCRVWVINREKQQNRVARSKKGIKPAPGSRADVEMRADSSEPSLAPWAASRACDGGLSGAARDLAATKVLYELVGVEVPVYRLLPPPFRDWWVAQLDALRRAKELDTEASRESKAVADEARCTEIVTNILLHATAIDDSTNGEGDDKEAGARRAAGVQRRAKAAEAAKTAEEAKKKAAEVTEATDSWEDLLSDEEVAPLGQDDEDDWEAQCDEEIQLEEEETVVEEAEEEEEDAGWRQARILRANSARDRAYAESCARGDKLRDWWLERKKSAKYVALRAEREALPARGTRDTFVALTGDPKDEAKFRDAVVVCGETGSGKTTQLPHYLLDAALCAGGARADELRIIVTQPRRVAATSVAQRVAAELGEDEVGGLAGYHIRHERRVTKRTKLLFCTAGVLLRTLRGFEEDADEDDFDEEEEDDNEGRNFVKRATHIILDEVHERAADGDLLLAALRRQVAAQRRRKPCTNARALRSRKTLSLVLMSATLDSQLFQKYLDAARGDRYLHETPLVHISGRTHPVADYYLEDIIAATRYHVAATNNNGPLDSSASEEQHQGLRLISQSMDKESDKENQKLTRRCMERYEGEEAGPLSGNARLDYDLLMAALEAVALSTAFVDGAGNLPGGDYDASSILVFLPGVTEIRRLADRLRGSRAFGHFVVCTLHANAARDEQRKAFDPPPENMRKIVLATNVAESSVTLPDVSTVVDVGRVKEVRHAERDANSPNAKSTPQGGETKLFAACPTLATTWCSRASARQRAGRAGRVRPGICVRLYSRNHFDHRMASHQQPELQRIPLEELILSIKMACDEANQSAIAIKKKKKKKKKTMDVSGKDKRTFFGCAADWLGECAQPPPKHALCAALSELVSVGALGGRKDEEQEEEEEDWVGVESAIGTGSDERLGLTPLGRHLARLPVHPRLGKMLVYGTLFGCLDPVASVAAAVGSSGRADALFIPEATRQQASARLAIVAPARADLVAAGRALDAYRLAGGAAQKAQLARRLALHEPAVREALEARESFLLLLQRAGLLDSEFLNNSGKSSNRRFHQDARRQQDTATASSSVYSRHNGNANVVAAVLVGALAPHVARVDSAATAVAVLPNSASAVESTNNASLSLTASEKKKQQQQGLELSVPKLNGALLALDDDAGSSGGDIGSTLAAKQQQQLSKKCLRFERARLSPSSFIKPAELDAAACHLAFFSRRWESSRARLQIQGCAVATPFALLLMYPGRIHLNHQKREATIANWIKLPKTSARTALLLRELRKKLARTLGELISRPPAHHGFSADATLTIDVIARLLAEEPTRAILGE